MTRMNEKQAVSDRSDEFVTAATVASGVGILTPPVKEPDTPRQESVDPRSALMAAEIYAIRLAAGLEEVVELLRSGESQRALEAWSGAESGIHSLAEIIYAVQGGADTPVEIEQELGHLALGLHEVAVHCERGNFDAVAATLDRELIDPIQRLADCLPALAPAV